MFHYIEQHLLIASAKIFVIYTKTRSKIKQAAKFALSHVNCDHNTIGRAYILFSVVSGVIGILMSTVMRLELHKPQIQIYNKISKLIYKSGDFDDQAKHLYNVTLTAHGLIMIFYMLMPMLINGFGNLNIPEQLNIKSMAFPKMGATSLALLILSLAYAVLSLLTKGTPTEYGTATG